MQSCREIQDTQFMFNDFFEGGGDPAIYEIMWKIIVVLDRPQMSI